MTKKLQIDQLISNAYKSNNFMIRYNDEIHNNNLCYVYFSSNALYEKGNSESFKSIVVDANRYEWSNITKKYQNDLKPAKEIFVRDIYLSWYVKGINCKINSYDKLIALIGKLTEGYRVRCIGASSGGFIASIVGMTISA